MNDAPPLAATPEPPYYAVIFTSVRTDADDEGYARMAALMVETARSQPGYLGVESARGADGVGITVSYWASEEAIRAWKLVAEMACVYVLPLEEISELLRRLIQGETPEP